MKPREEMTGFAIDLGGTKTAAARIENRKIIERKILPTYGAAALGKQLSAMADLLASVGYQRGDRLGVAITGRVDKVGVWYAVNQETLTEINASPIAKSFDDIIGPATIINDAAAATLAEAHFGSGRGCKNFGYITVSTGVGGGLFLGGRLHQSINGVAGHIGFTTSSRGTQMCGSGRHGTVESVAGGNAIARAAKELGHSTFDARDVFARAAENVSWAVAIVDESAHSIAELCANLTTTLGLDAVAIGGSIGMAEGYLERIQEHSNRLPPIFQTRLTRASLGDDGPLLGALLTRMIGV